LVVTSADKLLRNPIAGSPGCCARAASGHWRHLFSRRLCRPTCRAHRARGGWNHSRRCPRDIRPPEPLHCPVDICPVDIFAQRQHVWIARPTLKAIDQEQSLATVHHAIAGSPAARSPPLPMSHYPFDWGRRPHRNLPERRPRTETSVQGPVSGSLTPCHMSIADFCSHCSLDKTPGISIT
jgi:hypothetical protein